MQGKARDRKAQQGNLSRDELAERLAAHRRWRTSGGKEGARADFTGANLAGASLPEDVAMFESLAHVNTKELPREFLDLLPPPPK